MRDEFYAADLFCGAGGTSTGLIQAATERGRRLNLLAVNHWAVAVDTHTRNHPWARHLCADLGCVDPSKVIPGGRLDLLVASPECTHFSSARGGKPCSDQSRASAWHVLHWVERLRVEEVLIENVREFEGWGPLGNNGQPNKKKRGETFKAFIAALRSLGYAVEWRVLNAADYGDATCRKRLFVRASRSGKITWPEPTHAGHWRPAAEVIDWDLRGESIFKRKRPLKPATMRRIEAGLRKFGGEPFIAILKGHSTVSDVGCPTPTMTAHAGHLALCQPLLVEYHGERKDEMDGGDKRVKSVREPLGVQTAENRFGLCRPFVVQVAHGGSDESRIRSSGEPLVTIPAGHRGELGLCTPFIVTMEHSGRQPIRSTNDPLPTITTARGGSFGVCQPFVTKYYGTEKSAKPVTDPLDTITAKDRFALVEPGKMDIFFRMLQPHELAKAMGFDGYEFAGTKTDQVRQIGNAVSVRTAKALCGEIIGDRK